MILARLILNALPPPSVMALKPVQLIKTITYEMLISFFPYQGDSVATSSQGVTPGATTALVAVKFSYQMESTTLLAETLRDSILEDGADLHI